MQKSFLGFMNINSQEEMDNYIKNLLHNYPESCSILIQKAQRFVEGEYIFDNEWDMERSRVPYKMELEHISWNESPNGDPEWLYMLHRQRFLIDIAYAFLFTKKEVFKNYLNHFLNQFLKHNPLTERNKAISWRTLDVGLRLSNWIKILELSQYTQLISSEQEAKLFQSIHEQAKYLANNLSLEKGQSNWQILELKGLYAASLTCSDFIEAQVWKSKAIEYLWQSLDLQLEVDGLQREQSFMYHNEVLIALLEVLQLSLNFHQKLPQLMNYIRKMIAVSELFMKPNGMQPAYGDSDVENMKGIFQIAQSLGIMKSSTIAESTLDFYAQLTLGNTQPRVSDDELKVMSHQLESSGIMFIKNKQDYTLFKCGLLGGGHGHDDQLHFEIFSNGQDVLIDSGRYSYDVTKDRLLYKSAYAHNTVTIDHQSFNQHSDAWGSNKVSTAVNQKMFERSGVSMVEGGHLGYMKLEDSTFINRKIIYFEEGFWIISDEIFCQDYHESNTHFHFASENVDRKDGRVISKDLSFVLEPLFSNAQIEIENWGISPSYNEKVLKKRAIVKNDINGDAVFTYLLSPEGLVKKWDRLEVYSEGVLMTDNVVEAFSFELENGLKKTLILQHVEPNHGRRAYKVNDIFIYGRVAIVNQIEGKLEKIVLC